MPSEVNVLAIADLNLKFRDRTIFDNLNLSVRDGESIAILGPSGSGKSSLLSIVLGLMAPTSGSIRIDGETMNGRSADDKAKIRADKIGMVFQFAELLPEMNPVDNVALPALLSKNTAMRDPYQRAGELLSELNVPLDVDTDSLSGGERQRTAVARALINEPRLVLADEPTGSLDQKSRDLVAELLYGLPRRYGCGMLIATHDLQVAQRADRIFQVENHRLESAGESA
ncbi:ABC transporter ATP-binding protein [Glycomyces salinus]|uniref:ABC transporter ATP-binding protein n=1 Tax=Glycomyces salinus TaxID=980294 RepID=UPI0018ECD9DF|nr:ATP-binding cassette domain-containing protein [Glycomyces salinus]